MLQIKSVCVCVYILPWQLNILEMESKEPIICIAEI